MDNYPLISIVILNWNGRKYLENTLPAIQGISYSNFEIIVVDNGSTDNSVEFIKEQNNVTLIENGVNLGYSRGKNLGVKKANGEYIYLIDNDILIKDKDLLLHLLDFSREKNDRCLISVPLFDNGHDTTVGYGSFGRSYFLSNNRPLKIDTLISLDYYKSISLIGGNIFCRASVWKRIGGFDSAQPFNLDDSDLGIRSWLFNYPCYILSKYPQLHIGLQERINTKRWCWKYRYYYSGIMRIIIKNLKPHNVIFCVIIFNIFVIYKTIKQSFYRKSIYPLFSHLWSIYFFLKCLPNTYRERRTIQSSRIIDNDYFFKIIRPN